MNRDLRAMMDADPQIELDAKKVTVATWGGHAASYQRLAEAMDADFPDHVTEFFDETKREFSRRVLEAKKRLTLR